MMMVNASLGTSPFVFMILPYFGVCVPCTAATWFHCEDCIHTVLFLSFHAFIQPVLSCIGFYRYYHPLHLWSCLIYGAALFDSAPRASHVLLVEEFLTVTLELIFVLLLF